MMNSQVGHGHAGDACAISAQDARFDITKVDALSALCAAGRRVRLTEPGEPGEGMESPANVLDMLRAWGFFDTAGPGDAVPQQCVSYPTQIASRITAGSWRAVLLLNRWGALVGAGDFPPQGWQGYGVQTLEAKGLELL